VDAGCPALRYKLARLYRLAWSLYGGLGRAFTRSRPRMGKIIDAVQWEVDHFEEVPVLVVPCLRNPLRLLNLVPVAASSHYGSIYPAIQNFLLACRAEVPRSPRSRSGRVSWPAGLWGCRSTSSRFAVIPIGWPTGRYGPTSRNPVEAVVHFDRWGNRPGRSG
jgi:hypothetical protein